MFSKSMLFVMKETKVYAEKCVLYSCVWGLMLLVEETYLLSFFKLDCKPATKEGRFICLIKRGNETDFWPLCCIFRELVEELHPLMKEALERRPEVKIYTQ